MKTSALVLLWVTTFSSVLEMILACVAVAQYWWKTTISFGSSGSISYQFSLSGVQTCTPSTCSTTAYSDNGQNSTVRSFMENIGAAVGASLAITIICMLLFMACTFLAVKSLRPKLMFWLLVCQFPLILLHMILMLAATASFSQSFVSQALCKIPNAAAYPVCTTSSKSFMGSTSNSSWGPDVGWDCGIVAWLISLLWTLVTLSFGLWKMRTPPGPPISTAGPHSTKAIHSKGKDTKSDYKVHPAR